MRKPKFDKKYLKISLYSFAVLAACIVLSKFLDNVGGFFGSLSSFFGAVEDMLCTFIYGFFIAFFFTPLVNFLEKFIGAHSSRLKKRPKLLRSTTILITYTVFIGCFIWLLVYMIPTVVKSFNALFIALPENMEQLMDSLPTLLSGLDEETRQTVINSINSIAVPLQNQLNNLPQLILEYFKGDNFVEVVSGTFNVVRTVLNFLIGIIISFYMLSTKEDLASQGKKLCLALMEDGRAERFISNMQRVNVIFQNFVLGKLLDAIVLGVMCFVGMVILRIPYALVISVVIGVTNMIPYVGPFIGTVPAVFIVFLVSPIKALWLLIYIYWPYSRWTTTLFAPDFSAIPQGLLPWRYSLP